MGLLDKFIREAGKQVGEKIADAAGKTIKDSLQKAGFPVEEQAQRATQTSSSASVQTASSPESGFSWGETMPDEENQYNYGGTYVEYFDQIFKNEFSEYRVEQESLRKGKITVFTFWKDSTKALVVELLSENSQAENTRFQCSREKIPYTRFYYNHHGWWNTKAYVIKRTRDALNA
ncbi:MAG: hypothetical protein ILN61_08745 [Lachnospiraceae bacterium]|nr:hypothetical protein [Lachnospiraceae bacterium]MBP5415310.1 hypothetical protein [Lachnospiraceae bacterium]